MRDEPTRFDEICAQLDEWDNLPTVTPKPAEPDDEWLDDDQRQQPLDELILAGLVAPY